MKIGFIGLGNMGQGMAGNLLQGGHEVTVYNRTPEKAKPLLAQGAVLASQVAEACQGEIVITMLADDKAAEGVVFGEAGILRSLARGAVHVSSSTISVALAERLESEHTKADQKFVSAPVFGRPEAAAGAKLFFAVAGESQAVELCRPLFEVMGQRTFIFGAKPSAANLVKISGNFLISVVIESLGEAFALVGKADIDLHQYLDFLTTTLFAAPIYKTYGAIIAERKFKPAGFAAPLGFKDNRLVLAAAENLRVPLPLANLVRDRFLTLLARGDDSLDWSAISQLASEDAGARKLSE
jgi:3-hydroxyisobutyrate dehydrogenase-like beta-hydroxyacid dehydrogenase